MKSLYWLIGTTFFLIISPATADPPRVSTDIAPVFSLVARVMDGVGLPDLIIQHGATPHGYSMRPSEAAAIENSELIFYGKKAPIDKIKNCKIIGLSSGASAPEELVQNFIAEIKENMNVSIEEIVTANEKVVFKLPKELN